MTFKVFAFLTMLGCFYFSALELFFWESPSCRRLFGVSIDFSSRTRKFGFMMGIGRASIGLLFIFGFVYLYNNGITGQHILIFAMSIALFVGICSMFLFGGMRFLFLQIFPSLIGLFFI